MGRMGFKEAKPTNLGGGFLTVKPAPHVYFFSSLKNMCLLLSH